MSDHLQIVVVGASGRFVAASACAAGYAVSVFDLFGDSDTQQICRESNQFLPAGSPPVETLRIESLQSLAEKGESTASAHAKRFHELAGMAPHAIIFSGGAENHPQLFRSDVLPESKIAGPAADSIQRLLCLKTIEEICDRCGIRHPSTIGSPDQVIHGDRVWLRKQIRSGGGLQTVVWEGRTAVDFSAGGYLQELIEGETISGCYVAARQERKTSTCLLGVCAQLPCESKDDFRYHGSEGPIALAKSIHQEVARVGECIADEFQLVGVFGIDFVINDGRLFLIDINPRITASAELIERSFQTTLPTFTIVGTHLDACLRGQLPAAIETKGQRIYSKRIVYLDSDRKLEVSTDLVDYFESQDHITDIPEVGSEIAPNHPLVTIHAQARDNPALEIMTEKRICELKQQLQIRQA